MIRSLSIGLLLATLAVAPAVSAQEFNSRDREFYGGDYRIVSRMNGMCLNVSGGRIHEGAVLITWDCVDAHNERFRARPEGPRGMMQLTVAGPDGPLCVEMSSLRGVQLQLARCRSGRTTQLFRYTARRPFAIDAAGTCVNIEGQRRERGTRVISWPCSGEPNEAWTFERAH